MYVSDAFSFRRALVPLERKIEEGRKRGGRDRERESRSEHEDESTNLYTLVVTWGVFISPSCRWVTCNHFSRYLFIRKKLSEGGKIEVTVLG
jgi:hypothetical protein